MSLGQGTTTTSETPQGVLSPVRACPRPLANGFGFITAVIVVAAVGITGASPVGQADARQRRCDLTIPPTGMVGPIVFIHSLYRVSCARAKRVVRDYARRVHSDFNRDHVIDGFHIRYRAHHGGYDGFARCAEAPEFSDEDDCRFFWEDAVGV